MMLDLDGFKNVNDTAGHDFGDSVLKDIAMNLKSLIRTEEDFICRVGGDEFVLVTYDQDEMRLRTMTEKIHSYFRNIPEQDISYGVTISIGACSTSNKKLGLEALIKAADSQLYKAKSNGRNQSKFVNLD